MKKTTVIFLLGLCFASSAYARFAEFVLVTPGLERAERYSGHISTNPVLTIAQSNTNTFTVTIPLKGTKQHQQYWVLRCKSPVAKGKMDFRQHVWGARKRAGIESSEIVRITPGQKALVLQIGADAIDRTYIYRDYARMVMDGGYYYCFDLPAYYRKQKVEQAAAQVQSEGTPSD